ncbi:Aspartic peptidase [Heracleum sosnowskyi]|uniref:Aspartic peptidase n=1 Tax=Heracleum sosnowskyi TaxID=360622 RepID=A0AAD8HX93_9APIA|nr:Aspartic peptidase [Heracleum sosnowskyi]
MQIIPRLFVCFITLTFLSSLIQSSPSGFSINLIHRDSQLSPYHNASNTFYDILRNSLRRDMARYSRIFAPKLASSPLTLQSPMTADDGAYLMKISLGTPSLDYLAIADTGSHITWIQCKPCIKCYKQNAPLFDPKKSSTYKNQPCQSKVCQKPLFCGDNNFCHYEITYGDGSYSDGDISSESFTFGTTSGKPVVLPKVSFGCGHKNGGNFDKFTDGIVGLGNNNLSIINQLSHTINGKFSYCMVPLTSNVSSKISFGSDAIVSGSGAQTTPFFTKDGELESLFYFLNLESASIGETNIKFVTETYPNNANDKDGNIIIDSGTTLTYLPSDFYQNIEDEFKRIISLKPVKAEPGFSLCYKKEEGFEEKVPTITFHFTGADWELGALNTMLDMKDGKLCFTLVPGDGIFGNLHQMNYLVGYDLNAKTVSFRKTDCTKH